MTLRELDFLLLLAAAFLLVASLDVKSRPIRVSAQQVTTSKPLLALSGGSSSSSGGGSGSGSNGNDDAASSWQYEAQQPNKQQAQLDRMMHKIKKNLLSANKLVPHEKRARTKPVREQDEDKNHNSYRYFANETNNTHNQLATQHHPKLHHEVRVEFLRSTSQNQQPLQQQPHQRQLQQQQLQRYQNSTNSLFLLNYAPITGSLIQPGDDENDIQVNEQQQPPPFAMFPQGAPIGSQPNQLQQQQMLANALLSPQNNIRQILQNYQRYPQAAGQQLAQLQPQLNSVANQNPSVQSSRNQQSSPQRTPHTSQPAVNQQAAGQRQQPQQQQQQQPLNALQILTAPFQAFLPGLSQPGQQHQQSSGALHSQTGASRTGNSNNNNNIGHNRPKANTNAATGEQHNPSAPHNQQPPVAAQQPPQLQNLLNALRGSGQLIPPAGGQAGQMPNLQSLYQQLPIYQALLAARQRQEALQTAEKMRQQQQQQQQPNDGLVDQTRSNLLRPPYGQVQPDQPPPLINNAGWLGPQLQQQPYLPQQNNLQQQPPAVMHNQQQAHGGQPHNTNNQAVQFDDDNNNQQQPNPNSIVQPAQEQAQPEQQDNNGNSNQPEQQDNGQDNGGNNSNDAGNGNDQQNDSGKQEAEDPEMKEFQKMVDDGGNGFSGLFPPGILSNHDINDINKGQEEQAKKQEEEERRKQQQQQHQQQQQQQQQEQPINQFVPDNNQPQQPAQEDNNSPANNENSDNNDEQGNNIEGNGEDQGGEDQGGDDQGGQDNGGGEDSPTAAALTAKSASNESVKQEKLAKSPGVEYAARRR